MEQYIAELVLRDGFSKTFNIFTKSINSINKDLSKVSSTSSKSTSDMKKHVNSLAEQYKKAGMSSSNAMKRAWAEIDKAGSSGVTNNTKNANSYSNGWVNAFQRIRSASNNLFKSMSDSSLSTITKLTAGIASVAAVKKVGSEALTSGIDYEKAGMLMDQMFGENATKEYKFQMERSRLTPFSETEMINAKAREQSLGLNKDNNFQQMYEDLGSWGKLTGTGDIISAVDAVSDAVNGEFERFQTITGYKKDQVRDWADQNGYKGVINKNGQIKDKDKMEDLLNAFLGAKGISGITDKYGKTLEGRISTMKGNIQNALAKFIGIGEDGKIKDGSMFEKIGQIVESFINRINAISESANFDSITSSITNIFQGIGNAILFIVENPSIVPLLLGVGKALLALKIATSVSTAISTLNTAFNLLKDSTLIMSIVTKAASIGSTLLSLALSPVGLIALSVVGALGLVYSAFKLLTNQNVQDWINKQLESFKEFGAGLASNIYDWFINIAGSIAMFEAKIFDGIIDFFDNIWNRIKSIFTGEEYEESKSTKFQDKVDKATDYLKNNKPSWMNYKSQYVEKDNKESFTAKDSVENGDYSYNSTNSTKNQTKVEINMNNTITKEVDADKFMETFANKLDNYAPVRN